MDPERTNESQTSEQALSLTRPRSTQHALPIFAGQNHQQKLFSHAETRWMTAGDGQS